MRINTAGLWALALTTGLLVVGPVATPVVAQNSLSVPTCNQITTGPNACIKGNTTSCPLLATPASSPAGPPLTISTSGLYFQPSLGGASPLLGESFEYLCHVCQPNFDKFSLNGTQDARCTLNNFPSRFTTMQTNQNNVIRLEAIFNFSNGRYMQPCCMPYVDEQPFYFNGTKWNLNRPDRIYLRNLGIVVNTANTQGIVVEVTLFDPWDGYFQGGPFYSANEVNGRGFGQERYFISFTGQGQGAPWTPTCGGDDPWTDTWSDASPYCGEGPWTDLIQVASTDTGNNCFSRHAQAMAIKAVVQQLKQYPNVIWEVANEPESFGTPPMKGVTLPTLPEILQWEQWVVSQIIQWDGKRDATGACNTPVHPIQINGHYWDPSSTFTTSAWAFASTAPAVPATSLAESLHYAFNQHPPDKLNPGYYGAIDFWRPLPGTQDVALNPSPPIPVGFNEGIRVPDLPDPSRNDEGVRNEALEFIMNGGARFDGYSLNYQDSSAQAVSVELGYLSGSCHRATRQASASLISTR